MPTPGRVPPRSNGDPTSPGAGCWGCLLTLIGFPLIVLLGISAYFEIILSCTGSGWIVHCDATENPWDWVKFIAFIMGLIAAFSIAFVLLVRLDWRDEDGPRR